MRVGPGDDCAVVAMPGNHNDLLLKTDCIVGGVHFEPGTEPTRIGHKALARVLSDIAAMAGRPSELLVTLVLPSTTSVAWVDAFYDGLGDLAGESGCQIVGGELSRMPAGGPAVISIAATGHVHHNAAILRSGGRPGDVLAVTGRLGDSFSSGHHLDFLPRLAEAQWLAKHGAPHAMMDLSDGLARDLPRLASASSCGYRVTPETLPCRDGATTTQAVDDGEDYELLLALPADTWKDLAAPWKKTFPETPLTAIGSLTDGPCHGLPEDGGWDPFQSPALATSPPVEDTTRH